RPCGAPDRGQWPEGVAPGRCAGLGQARQFHSQHWHGQRRRHRGTDRDGAARGLCAAGRLAAARGSHYRGEAADMSRISTEQVKAMGKVALVQGGWAAEREVSLNSGARVLAALRSLGVDVTPVDPRDDGITKLAGFDRAFIIVHGRGGEDGVLQATLEMLGVPYTGTGVLGSALGMDTLRTKLAWRGAGLPTPDFVQLRPDSDWETVVAELGLPLMVKPSREGSSIGMAKVESAAELERAYRTAVEYDSQVIAERWISGAEYTVGILDQQALPVI